MLLGGPAFSSEQTIEQWQNLPGVSAIFAGQAGIMRRL